MILFSIDGHGQDSITSGKRFNLPKSEQSFDVSFRFPVGAFGDDFHPNEGSTSGGIVESMEGTRGGMGSEMGYELSVSGNYYFEKKPSKVNTGLRITYASISTFPFTWKTRSDYIYNKGDFTNLNFLSVKAGIVMRIEIGERKSIVVYDQLCYAYCWNGGMTYDESYYIDPYTRVSDHAELHLHSGSGLRDELAICYRSNVFVTSFGFSFGKITFNNAEFSRDASAPGYTPLYLDLKLKPSMSTSTLFLSVGLGF